MNSFVLGVHFSEKSFLNIYFYSCSAYVYVHVYLSTHRGRKRALDPLEWELTKSLELRSKHWSSLEEQQMSLPTKPSLQASYLLWSVGVVELFLVLLWWFR